MATEIIMTGKPTLKKSMKEMWCPSTSAFDAITMLAEAPMRVPLPPKQAPKASAQASGSMLMPTTLATIFCMTGTMVAVKGMLSTKAEKMALDQQMRKMEKAWRPPGDTSDTMLDSVLAMKRSSPNSPTPSTTTNRAAKKSSVSHSTACSASWQWCMSNATSSHTAPMIATHAGSRCVTGCRKKEAITQPNTTPHLISSPRSVIGYIFWSLGMSTTRLPLTSAPNHQMR
mmetsp:Transcript_36916/g.75676  ORF Transcript_36916/g.75676 Transcript_36916/m.75676 type:complete len:229 (-) Transcript_36916:117-803(-)